MNLDLPGEWVGSTVRIHSYAGALVADFVARNASEQLDVSNWAEGMYFATATAVGGQVWTATFSVIR
jgi:hypothetical protein